MVILRPWSSKKERKVKSIILFLKIHIKPISRIKDEKKMYSGVKEMRDGFLFVENKRC